MDVIRRTNQVIESYIYRVICTVLEYIDMKSISNFYEANLFENNYQIVI